MALAALDRRLSSMVKPVATKLSPIERYLHLVDRYTQERKRLAVNKIHNAGGCRQRQVRYLLISDNIELYKPV